MGNYEISKHLPPGFYRHDNAHVKSSVMCECLFSQQIRIKTQLRNRPTPYNLDSLITLAASKKSYEEFEEAMKLWYPDQAHKL